MNLKPPSTADRELRVKKRKKKLLKYALIISAVIFGFVVVSLYGILSLRSLDVSSYPEPRIMKTVTSPDGKYAAHVFEWDGGAMSGFRYRLSILESNKKISKGMRGNTHISESYFDVKWIDNKTLQVYSYGSDGGKFGDKVWKQETLINGIKIEYKFLRE